MTIRRSNPPVYPVCILLMVAGMVLAQGGALAQAPADDPLQIDPPPVPRYRRERPTFQISADPASKPLPPPAYLPPSSYSAPPTRSQLPPSAQELAKKQARAEAKQRQIEEQDHRNTMLLGVGKGIGFVVVVGAGIYAVADIARQIRTAKAAAANREEDEEYEDDDLDP